MSRIPLVLSAIMIFSVAVWAQTTLDLPMPESDQLSAEFSPADFVHWQIREIGDRQCLVSPPLVAPAGGEVNHNQVTVTFSGGGSLEAAMVYSNADNFAECVERTAPRFMRLTSGQARKFTTNIRVQRYAWLVLRASGDLEIEHVSHSAWMGNDTVYGHLPGVFRFSGANLQFRFMYPNNYDPQESYPLVVSVGGSGGVGTDNVRSMEMVVPGRYLFTNYYDDEQLECFSLVAQIAPPDSVPAPYYPTNPTGPGRPDQPYHPDWPLVNENGWYTQGTLALVEALIARDDINIDVDRIYYAGFSYGGKGCWEFLKAGREVFAGAICVAGWPIGRCYSQVPPSFMPRLAQEVRRYRHIPVYICSGSEDPMRLSSQVVHEEIQRQNGTSFFVEFPNTSHVSSAGRAWGNPIYFQWLFEQNRSQNPPAGPDPFPQGEYDQD